LNIKITGCGNTNDGYGEITQNLALALDFLGHKVWVNPVDIWRDDTSLKPRTKELLTEIKPDFELIIMYPTYGFQNVHRKAAIMTMYEAHICPTQWAKRLNQLKLPLYAPSVFVAEMFRDSGVKVPINVLTLGVDSQFYFRAPRKFPKGRPFRFLTMGKLEPRKNVEVAVRCFQDAFFNDKVELIIKTRERFLSAEVKRMAKRDTRIRLIEQTLSEEELRKLFYYCDAFIYPSRGEGFAFPPRNAVATGMPTLVTGWSALAEIPGAIKIPIEGMSPMPPCGFSYGDHDKMLMANINEDKLLYEMYCLATDKKHYEDAVKEVAKARQKTWLECAIEFIKLAEKT
jgi:glycosyltransferase involved in cell wall biosynthesis